MPGPLFLALLVPLATGLLQLGDGTTRRLELVRGRVLASEPWRLASAHFVHYSLQHWLVDALAFGALLLVCGLRAPARTLATLALSAPAISLAVLAWVPGLERYRGLSGLDSALFGLALALELRARRAPLVLVAGALFAAKVAFELATGTALFVDGSGQGFTPVPLAHAVGALVGLACGLVGASTRSPWPVAPILPRAAPTPGPARRAVLAAPARPSRP
ncbi:MAG TPA: rhombosortase [Planctomycetota bacterium]